MHGLLAGTVLVLALVVGCSSGGGSTPCTVGQSIACVCSTGAAGSQTCQPDGTYATCSCTSPGGDGGWPGDMAAAKKLVFVTSAKVAGGDLHRPLAADGRCATAASNAGLTQGSTTWKAWLSGISEDAIDRIANAGPWYLVDGTGPAFNNAGDLTGNPLIAINKTEYGVTLNGPVWTGTASGGTSRLSSATDATWTEKNTLSPCTSTASVYCFEQ